MFRKHLLAVLFLFVGVATLAQTITAKDKETVLANVKKQLAEHYHFKDKVQPTIAYLEQQWKSGRYNALHSVASFTEAVSEDLKKTAGDEHLNLFCELPIP